MTTSNAELRHLIIASFISADSVHFENFQLSHGGISLSLTSCFDDVIYLCEILKSTNRCKILNFESRSTTAIVVITVTADILEFETEES